MFGLQKLKFLNNSNIKDRGQYPVVTQEKGAVISGYSDENNPVTDLPIILFGDHSRSLKYLDFAFFRGADGTVLLKPNKDFIPLYFYYVLQYGVLNMIEKKGTYERHYKYLQNLYVPLPPKDIQEKIIAEIEAVEKEEAEKKREIKWLNARIISVIETQDNKEYKLGDVVSLEFGVALPESKRINGIYPVVGSNGIIGFHNSFLIKGPVIIVGRKGSVGKVNWIADNCTPIDTTFYVRLLDESCSLKALYYVLKKVRLETISGGVGVPGLNRNDAYATILSLPPTAEQHKIAAEIEAVEARIAEAQKTLDAAPERKNAILRRYL
jgi:restriction endonuclease S subunit